MGKSRTWNAFKIIFQNTFTYIIGMVMRSLVLWCSTMASNATLHFRDDHKFWFGFSRFVCLGVHTIFDMFERAHLLCKMKISVRTIFAALATHHTLYLLITPSPPSRYFILHVRLTQPQHCIEKCCIVMIIIWIIANYDTRQGSNIEREKTIIKIQPIHANRDVICKPIKYYIYTHTHLDREEPSLKPPMLLSSM